MSKKADQQFSDIVIANLIEHPRSKWEFLVIMWWRHLVLLFLFVNMVVLTVTWHALSDARHETIVNRTFGAGNREVTCAILRDHTVPGSALYSEESVRVYKERC